MASYFSVRFLSNSYCSASIYMYCNLTSNSAAITAACIPVSDRRKVLYDRLDSLETFDLVSFNIIILEQILFTSS